MAFDIWHLTYDIWHMTSDIWHLTFGIWHSTNGPMDQYSTEPMDQLTNGPMDQWTSGPMEQWTNEPMDQWTNGAINQHLVTSIALILFKRLRVTLVTSISSMDWVKIWGKKLYIVAQRHYKSSCRSQSYQSTEVENFQVAVKCVTIREIIMFVFDLTLNLFLLLYRMPDPKVSSN